ncbi:cyclic nucleotide-binding domain-containing protein [Oceanicella actignis]|uniref:cyclic nucleotide-binding domain-containing protein n=1 Tax=Oceanicella actignis TaxID=1189325 RepID=UPI0011E7FBFC|nr:cyclic nucleotide-binding domain-containing protein [Oceanicella actignis]TYO91377.1 CRP/FNR family transcriptional activator FtrB [Oceanicella actignis]
MPESLHPDVRALPLFSQIAEDSFQALMRGAYVQNFPPHVELIVEGETSDFLHILLSGTVELFARWNRRETTMALVRPVSTFILAATVKDAPYLMSARTVDKCRIAMIPSQDVREVFDQDAVFARAVVTELAQCYRAVIRAQKDLKLRSSLERLANFLLRRQRGCGGAAEFELGMEKRKLAHLLGMTPENLSRAFRALAPYGVRVEGERIAIDDQPALVRFAKPDPLIDAPDA